jgi:thiol-disulfide isomerase/thioredoxin
MRVVFAILLLGLLVFLGYFGYLLFFDKFVSDTNRTEPAQQREVIKVKGDAVQIAKEEGREGRDERAIQAQEKSGALCDKKDLTTKAWLPRGRVIKGSKDIRQGTWKWVNIWASWCKPCKEEMPMLAEFLAKTREKVEVIFLSVDDDERELNAYMAKDGNALKGTFVWVEEPREREAFYRLLGLKESPALPVHILLDPTNQVRCVRLGTIDAKSLEEAREQFRWE